MKTTLLLVLALACANVALGNGGRLVSVTDDTYHEKIVNVFVPEGYTLNKCTIEWQDINPAAAVAIGFELASPTSRIVEVPIRYGSRLNVPVPSVPPSNFGIPWSSEVPTFQSVVDRLRQARPEFTITTAQSSGVQRSNDGSSYDSGYIYFTAGEVEGAIFVRCQYVFTEPITTWAVNECQLFCTRGTRERELPNFVATIWNSRLTRQAAQGCDVIQKTAIQMAQFNIDQARIRSQIIAEASNATSETIMETWRNYNQVTDAALSRWSDAFRGVQDYPVGDGTSVKLPIGPATWWAGSNGTYVGVPAGVDPNSNQQPGVTYRQLEPAR